VSEMSRVIACVAAIGVVVLLVAGCSALGPVSTQTPIPSVSQTENPQDSQVAPSIEPVIVVAGVDVDGKNVTVSGYVAGVLENGGVCTFSFVGQKPVASLQSTGIADRSSTSCGSVQAPIGEFTRGAWKVMMSYTTLSGDSFTSEPATVAVP